MGNSNHVVLFDADTLLYRAGFACERRIVEEDDEGYSVSRIECEPFENAAQCLKEIVEYTLTECGTSDYHMYISGKNNFRKDIATIKEYKGNRKRSRRPLHYAELKEYICKHHPHTVVNGEEADDALGIELTKNNENAIVATNDKDLLMVPGKHINPFTNKKHLIEPLEGDMNFWHQLLTGDPTDNIMGCPGIGVKKAKKVLDGVSPGIQAWRIVRRLYRDQLNSKFAPDGFTIRNDEVTYPSWRTQAPMTKSLDEFIIENARLLWIRRQPMELWSPPATN